MWRVKRTDPWMWPHADMDDGSRTEEQIQVFSAFWLVAYHCLFFVDFYLWDGTGDWSPPPAFQGGHAEQPIGADGAAPLPRSLIRDLSCSAWSITAGGARRASWGLSPTRS